MKKSRTEKKRCFDAGPTPARPENLRSADEKDSSPTDWAYVLSTTQKSLELVLWRDANFFVEDNPFDGDYINATVGWIEEEDKWLKISSELTPDGERAVTRVPLVNVVSRRPLMTSASASTWTISGVPTE